MNGLDGSCPKTGLATCAGLVTMLVVTAVLYWRAVSYEFIIDDLPAIVENESIRALVPLFGIADHGGPLFPKRDIPLSARPLVNFTFAINYHFAGTDPLTYRVTEIVMHVVAGALLWLIIAKTLSLPFFEGRFDGCSQTLAFVGAFLWLVHPLNSETVVYVTQRTELMMGVFYFATLVGCLGYWSSDRNLDRILYLCVATSCSILGILCKESIATLPLVAMLYEWTFYRRSLGQILRRSWPLYLGLMSCWIVITAIYQSGFTTPGGGFGNRISATDWWLTQSSVVMHYLKLTFIPWPLVVHYEYPIAHSLGDVWVSVLALVGCSAVALWMLWKRSSIGFVLVCFLVALSPTLIVPLPGETVAERRMYVPLAFLTPLLVTVVYRLFNRLPQWSRFVSGSTALVVAILLMWVVSLRIPAYQTHVSIWKDTLEKQPHHSVASVNIGVLLAEQGQLEDARSYFENAVRISPTSHRALFNLARYYDVQGLPIEAVTRYREAIVAEPDDELSHYNLARLLENQGQFESAKEHYRSAFNAKPSFAAPHTNLAILLSEEDDWNSAIKHFEIAMREEPDLANAMNLMLAYVRVDRHADAIATAEVALRIAVASKNDAAAERIQSAISALLNAPDRPMAEGQ